ncbi:MAG: DNA primase [Ruminococcaceae bacterium]|nr:DNA primase [Oscillospiraceae bacterium]
MSGGASAGEPGKEVDQISGLIPESVIEEVKARNELVAVVEQYVRLDKKSGSNFFGLCPFHEEKTPSFSVSPAKQIYYCFGCHKGGDVIHFIMDMEKCAYPQAIRLLAERAGVTIPEPDDVAWQQRNERNKALQAICLEAARHFYRDLMSPEGRSVQAYLKKRALSPAVCKKFGLGYARDEWDSLLRHLNSLGYKDEELLIQSGLFRRGKSGGLYDLFRHRLMFPIMDAMGRIIAFGGRVLDDSQPKYINSPETPIYSKGRHLYALNLAKTSKKGHLVVVEGYMDAIALHQAGVDQAVASLGTALTEYQAGLLRKYAEDVVLAYDADAAGQAATLRSLDILEQHDLKVTVLQVPEAKDPDEFIRLHGPERFHALIGKALPLLDYKLSVARAASTGDTGLDPVAYQDTACDILAQEKNAIVRELYATRLAEEISTSTEAVLQEIERRSEQPAKEGRPPTRTEQPARQQTEKTKQPLSREELYLLALVAVEPSMAVEADLRQDDFSPGPMQELAARVLARAAAGDLDTTVLIELCGDLTVRSIPLHDLISRVSMQLDELFGRQDIRQAAAEQLWRQRKYRLRSRLAELNKQLSEEIDTAARNQLLQETLQLNNRLTELKQMPDWQP